MEFDLNEKLPHREEQNVSLPPKRGRGHDGDPSPETQDLPFVERRATRPVSLRVPYTLSFASNAPVSIQSMNNTDTCDVAATLEQIQRLHEAGCDLTRVAVKDKDAAKALSFLNANSPLPIVADIHFDSRLALEALEAGCPKIRINPGNIRMDRLGEIARLAEKNGAVIRVGVNSGSIRPALKRRYGAFSAKALALSALEAAHMLEEVGFSRIVLSMKSSDPLVTIRAYRYAAERCDYPFHVGVTEAGTLHEGVIRSSVGIGTLLADGIGDTVRVSLTADPVEEVRAAKALLKALHLKGGAELVSCPTCGRTEVRLEELALKIEARLEKIEKSLRIAVMGCRVNGPGEARDCDYGIAGGKDEYLLFAKGEVLGRVPEAEAEDALMRLIQRDIEKEKSE